MKLTQTFEAIVDGKPEVLIVRCIDFRFKKAFNAFPFKVLGLGEDDFIDINIGGGPTALAYPTETPSRCKALLNQIKLSCALFPTIDRIVLISHGGKCKYYHTIPGHRYQCGMEKHDLSFGGSLIKMALPQKKVELCNAYLVNNNREIEFETVSIAQDVRVPLFDWAKPVQLSS